uniref:Uncharacterized protein n=1 Tax=Romanomermis culicivorax TaxID=13658 RepID=A0A915IKA9_ROMCU
MQPNSFRHIKPLTGTTYPKVLTAPKVPKKKKKKQKDEWNKSPEVSDEEDPSLQPKSIFDNLKCLQAAVTLAMKSEITHWLMKLLNFPVSPIYKLAICNRIEFQTDPQLPPIPHKVDDVWIEHVAADQPLCHMTYQGTHYCYLPNTIISLLQVDGEWFRHLKTSMPLAVLLAPPCSATEYAYINEMLVPHTQNLDLATHTVFYKCMWYRADSNPRTGLTEWMNRIPEREPSFSSNFGTYVCNQFALYRIIFDEDFHMETAIEQIDIDESNYTAKPHSRFHFYSRLLNIINFQNRFSIPAPVYANPLRTMASVHTLTAEELLDHPTSAQDVEPTDEELLDTPIFRLEYGEVATVN